MPIHLDTPQKARILGSYKTLQYLGEKRKIETTAEIYNVCPATVLNIVSKNEPRRIKGEDETRGGNRYSRPKEHKISEEKLNKIVTLIKSNRFDGHSIDADTLRYKAEIPPVSDRYLRKRLKDRGYGRYIVFRREKLDEKLAADRITFVKKILSDFPTKEA